MSMHVASAISWNYFYEELQITASHYNYGSRALRRNLILVIVEPRFSGPPLSGTSIIWLGNFLFNNSKNGRVL